MQRIAPNDLLICLLSGKPDRRDGARLGALSDGDWRALLNVALQQQCRPQLYRSVDVPELEGVVPEDALEVLREAYLNNGARNLRLYSELRRILAVLAQHDVPVMLLKGAHLAHFVYGNIAARFMVDLDLMVHYPDVATVVDTLVARGYRPLKEFTLGPTPPPSHHVPQLVKDGDLSIEVHWTIGLSGAPVSIDTERLWERSVPVSFGGAGRSADARALCPADLLLHVCVHAAYNHKFTMGLRPYLDIAEVIHRLHGELDWDEVIRRADQWGSRRGVYLVLRLTSELMGTPVPAPVLQRLRPESCDPSILRAARKQIFADRNLDHSALPKLADLRAGGGPGRMLKAMARRLFPPFEYMAWHYPMEPGSPKVFFYYLVRWKEGLPSYGRMVASLLRRDASTARWAENRSKLSRWLAGAG